MKQYAFWKINLKNGIFSLCINRPEKKNAFNYEVIKELSDILEQEINEKIDQIRVVILSTTLNHYFTVGLDIDWLITLNAEQATKMTKDLQELYDRIEEIPVPVITAVKGVTYTAGFELMLCTDMVIAANNSKFAQVETKWSMTPAAGATQRLIKFVGPLNAKDIIYTSRVINSEEALQMGLINKIVPLEELETQVYELAECIINNSKKAISLSKKMINQGIYRDERGFEMEGNSFYECFKTGVPKQKLRRFLERNKK